MPISRTLRRVTGVLELILGIPFLGAMIVIGSGWSVLGVMLLFHIVVLVFSLQERRSGLGSILGIITSCLAWIPFLGMVLHLITAVVLLAGSLSGPRHSGGNRRTYLR
ncbi:hypothetical protein [Gorillibacterium sp. CAU 1737]|uniref:hypothetical protein n=1 Tax=Gorillibacterium sp. CAU 1737 TaxID=3140362 RepID=UPI00325FFE4A